jgi:hypothetical protein
MRIKERHFPYPVLADFSDDFVDSSYETHVTYDITPTHFILFIKHALNNEELFDMVKRGEAVFTTHIECAKTQTRLIEASAEVEQKILINASLIEKSIEVATFLIANVQLKGYSNKKFDEDYYGYDFNINKGDILAIGSDYIINLEKEKENNSESIIQIEKVRDNEPPMDLFFDSEKIVVHLSSDLYSEYFSLSENDNLLPVLHALIGIPALTAALQIIKNEIEEDDTLKEGNSNYRWYQVLTEKIVSLGINIQDLQNYDEIDILKLTQRIMGSPLSLSLKSLMKFTEDFQDEENEDETI